eukprot:SAG22_NODE_18126_length_292_cov_1.963731_1_plen_44_part_10
MSLAQSNDGYVHIGSTSSSSPVASQHSETGGGETGRQDEVPRRP